MNNNYNNRNENYKDIADCSNPCKSEVKELLEKINIMQKRAVREELDESCDRNRLGRQTPLFELNTRPVVLYAFNTREWEFPTEKKDAGCEGIHKSCVFRVEDIHYDTVTCRVLKPKRHREENSYDKCKDEEYESTNSFFTLKFIDIIAVRCLEDTFVDICIK